MTEIGLHHYLALSGILFGIGLFGIFWGRKTLISILLSIELLFLSTNINMVAFSVYLKDLVGQIFVLFILTVAAAEIAIGLAILVIYHRQRQTINIEDMSAMRG